MKFEVYQGRNKKWYWRLLAANGEIISDGGQGYSTSQNARRAVNRLVAAIRDGRMIMVETIKQEPIKQEPTKKKIRKKKATKKKATKKKQHKV